mmetsp:Transcript_12195/g.25691  ORF Transcript_12195/g.25691 Transcript_12195/m.25691 type:complete len:392 (-) Transcript_12195:141-1316(-)
MDGRRLHPGHGGPAARQLLLYRNQGRCQGIPPVLHLHRSVRGRGNDSPGHPGGRGPFRSGHQHPNGHLCRLLVFHPRTPQGRGPLPGGRTDPALAPRRFQNGRPGPRAVPAGPGMVRRFRHGRTRRRRRRYRQTNHNDAAARSHLQAGSGELRGRTLPHGRFGVRRTPRPDGHGQLRHDRRFARPAVAGAGIRRPQDRQPRVGPPGPRFRNGHSVRHGQPRGGGPGKGRPTLGRKGRGGPREGGHLRLELRRIHERHVSGQTTGRLQGGRCRGHGLQLGRIRHLLHGTIHGNPGVEPGGVRSIGSHGLRGQHRGEPLAGPRFDRRERPLSAHGPVDQLLDQGPKAIRAPSLSRRAARSPWSRRQDFHGGTDFVLFGTMFVGRCNAMHLRTL